VFIEAMESGHGYELPKGFSSTAPIVKTFFQDLGYKDGIFFEPYNWLFIPY
jgi:hypothetical protein